MRASYCLCSNEQQIHCRRMGSCHKLQWKKLRLHNLSGENDRNFSGVRHVKKVGPSRHNDVINWCKRSHFSFCHWCSFRRCVPIWLSSCRRTLFPLVNAKFHTGLFLKHSPQHRRTGQHQIATIRFNVERRIFEIIFETKIYVFEKKKKKFMVNSKSDKHIPNFTEVLKEVWPLLRFDHQYLHVYRDKFNKLFNKRFHFLSRRKFFILHKIDVVMLLFKTFSSSRKKVSKCYEPHAWGERLNAFLEVFYPISWFSICSLCIYLNCDKDFLEVLTTFMPLTCLRLKCTAEIYSLLNIQHL